MAEWRDHVAFSASYLFLERWNSCSVSPSRERESLKSGDAGKSVERNICCASGHKRGLGRLLCATNQVITRAVCSEIGRLDRHTATSRGGYRECLYIDGLCSDSRVGACCKTSYLQTIDPASTSAHASLALCSRDDATEIAPQRGKSRGKTPYDETECMKDRFDKGC